MVSMKKEPFPAAVTLLNLRSSLDIKNTLDIYFTVSATLLIVTLVEAIMQMAYLHFYYHVT